MEDHLGASSTQGSLVLSNHLSLLVRIQDVSLQKHTSQYQSDCNHFIIQCALPICSAKSLKFRSLSNMLRETVVSNPWWYFRAWCHNGQSPFYVDFQTWISSDGKSWELFWVWKCLHNNLGDHLYLVHKFQRSWIRSWDFDWSLNLSILEFLNLVPV